MLPALRGRLDGIASRVPVLDGSAVDLFVELDESTSVEAVHEAMCAAAASERLGKVLEVTDEPVVSSDVIGNPHSSIFDASFTQLNGRSSRRLRGTTTSEVIPTACATSWNCWRRWTERNPPDGAVLRRCNSGTLMAFGAHMQVFGRDRRTV